MLDQIKQEPKKSIAMLTAATALMTGTAPGRDNVKNLAGCL